MKNVIWQLPFKQSNLSNKDWVHYKAKLHAYNPSSDNSFALCGKYGFSEYHDKTTLKEIAEEFGNPKDFVCKACLQKIDKMREKEEREKPKYQVIIEASSFEDATFIQLEIEQIGIYGRTNIIKNKGEK